MVSCRLQRYRLVDLRALTLTVFHHYAEALYSSTNAKLASVRDGDSPEMVLGESGGQPMLDIVTDITISSWLASLLRSDPSTMGILR